MDFSPNPKPSSGHDPPKRLRLSTSLESKFGPKVRRGPDSPEQSRKMSRSTSETRRTSSRRWLSTDQETDSVSSDTNSMFDVLVSAAAQRKMSRERKMSKSGQTLYDVLVEATVERMGGWRRITPEDVLNVSREKTVLDTYNKVSTELKNTSSLPDPMATSMGGTSLYDAVINTVADIHLLRAEDVLEAAKKQTVYDILLKAMAAAKSKHSLELPKDSLYDELISKKRSMPDDVKEMLGQSPVKTPTKKISRKKSKQSSLEMQNTPRRTKKKEVSDPAPSVKKKFEEHGKRRVIDDYLKSPKKSSVMFAEDTPLKLQTARERKLTVVNTMRDSHLDKISPLAKDKPDLGDVIIAAAAAKMVKLDPSVPEPTSQEFGAQYCRKVLGMCQRGQWESAGEMLKTIEVMVADRELDRKTVNETVDHQSGNTPLMYAAIENNISFMERLVALGCNVNKKNKEGYIALHFAAMYSREDIVSWLVARKSQVSLAAGPMQQTCLHLASARHSGQSLQIVKVLLSHSSEDLRMKQDSCGSIPLFCAIESGNNNICKELLVTKAEEQVLHEKQPLGDTAMHLAARRRDSNLLKTLIEAGAQVDRQNSEGQTVMHLTCIQGDENSLRVLFMAKANCNLGDTEDRTPIHLAAERGFTRLVDFLIEKFKASIYDRTKDGSTLMHIAAINGHPDTAVLLFNKGVPLLMPNKYGARGIHIAAKEGHVNVIKTLLAKGEQIDAKTSDNKTALHIAVEHGKSSAVEILLGNGADVQIKGGETEETALHIAARIDEARGDKCSKILLKSGADPNLPMGNGCTPVHIAAQSGNLLVLRGLLQHGGDAQKEDKEGETALHKACKSCHFGIVRELVQFIHGFIGNTRSFINKVNKKGETALHYGSLIAKSALHFPDEDKMIVNLLMEQGSDIGLVTENTKESAIHYVAQSGNANLLKEIIEQTDKGIMQLSVNKQNNMGWSPLLNSSSRGHHECVDLLLSCNARVDVFDYEGRSALHLAADCGSMEVCKALLEKNAFVNSKNKAGLTALHFAAAKGFTDLVDFLITKSGAGIESLTIKKQTPLHLAAAAGQHQTCQKLIDLDAMVDWDDDLQQKPIHLAAQNDYTSVVKLFLQVRPSLVTSTVKDGNTLAHLAAKKGSVEVLRAMFEVDKLLVTNAVNRFTENTPLHLATEGGHLEAVKLMLLNGVAPNDENKFGLTPVHLAAKCGHADVFDVFAKTGVSLRQPSSKIGMTALHIAAFFGEEEIARELFKHIPAHTKSTLPTKPENALVEDLCYECDLTALHLASYSGSENVVRAILNQPGVDVKQPSSPSGYTALHLACLTGHVGVVGLLLSRSTELLQVKDRQGSTSLHIAATHGHFEMCQVLLGQGADCTIEDDQDWLALHCAAKGGYLDVVSFLCQSGSNTKHMCNCGKIPIWYACIENNSNVVEFLLRYPHDTDSLLNDSKFVYNLMKVAKNNNFKMLENYLFVSPAPAETSAKLSAVYRDMAVTEKERAGDLLEAADFCEELARQLVITSCHVENPVAILNAVDSENTPYIDVLIQCDQKMVVAEFVVQQYLQEIWEGSLNWSSARMLGFFVLLILFPPVWFFFSLPIEYKMNKIPFIKFLSYLTGHIYFVLFLSLTSVFPPNSTLRDSLFPYWYEIVSYLWYSGNFLSLLTNPPAKGGLSWVKPVIVSLGVIALLIHISAIFVPQYYWSLLIYIRNLLFGTTLLMCWIQVLDFLAFHPLFGPWAIIIGECLLDVGKFVVVLSLFVMGYAMLASCMNQPFGYPEDYIKDAELNPNNLTQKELFNSLNANEEFNPVYMFEVHFFALFGITSYTDVMASKYLQGWTFYMFKLVFASYLTLSIIVLINLLIAMMSDTYCRIQEQSDIEWKFGLAKLIRNMQRTNVAPSPLNLFTTWFVLLRKRFLEKKHEKLRAQLKFRRAMRDDIMQKAPGMRFVVEQRSKKKKKKPRVIHALGNIKWGFTPASKSGAINVDQLQNKWDRDHKMREQEMMTFGSNTSLEEFRLLSKSIPWAIVVRSYYEAQGRGGELKNQQGEERDKNVNDILKSITNVRNDRAKKEQAQKWSKMPSETKTKVISKWEEKAKNAPAS